MRPSASPYLWRIGVALMLLLCAAQGALAKLNENCTVSVLNRNVRVNPDGSWVLPNVPANFGQIRARATCVENGITTSGESALFTIPANGVVNLPEIVLGAATPIPVSLGVTPANVSFTAAGQTSQLTATATYPDGSVKDVTAATTGTNYTTSNPALIAVGADGLLTAVASGTVVIQATSAGAAGIVTATMVPVGTDSDGDGIPDDLELALELNPNDPVDAQEDFDRDGLTNLDEVQRGTGLRNPDTDGDGLTDGREVALNTSPLLTDTDGDGIRDGLEVQTGSDPTDPASFNLGQALATIEVTPSVFILTVNTVISEASRQLTVTGQLIDGNAINLTSATRGTNYASSDLTICNFGATDGLVFAGSNGSCTITVTNSGFEDTVTATVETFTPMALSFVSIPGFANNVDVNGDFAYVAAGAAGLQVVDVSDRTTPKVVAAFDTPGNANDVKVVGNLAYIADGSAGLQILDITDPLKPEFIGTINTSGNALDVVVKGNLAFVADDTSGLQILDIRNPAAPAPLGDVDTPGNAQGVDVNLVRQLAMVADGGSGVVVIDIANTADPVVVGNIDTGDARDVVLTADGGFALVADVASSLTTVDLGDPAAPEIRVSTPRATGGLLVDVALSDRFAFGADIFFVNGVPVVDVGNPASPLPRAILDFRNFRDDNGTGIAVDGSFVYLTASRGSSTRLYIGQYLALEDKAGNPPTVMITMPADGETVIERENLTITVEAIDDITVTAVKFLVDDTVAFIDTTAPYQFNFPVPVGVNGLTLGAEATDLGDNIGVADTVAVNVIPDPGTTVVGNVIDFDDNPLVDAEVVCQEISGRTDADGTFTIFSVPTIKGQIVCTATFVTPGGLVLRGSSSPVSPQPSGTTEVGTIILGQNTVIALDGVDDYIEIPSNLKNMGISNAFTITFWVKAEDGSGLHMLLEDGVQFNVSSFYLGVTPRERQIFVRLNTTTSSYFNDNIPVLAFVNRWANLAYSYDGTTIRLYLDGNLIFSQGISGNVINGNRNLRIGFPSGEHFYNGLVDELQIWNVALAQDEIRSTIARRLTGNEAGLVGYWSFDEGEGITTADLSPNGNDATLVNGPAWVVANTSGPVPSLPTILLDEDFEDGVLDDRVTIETLRIPLYPDSSRGAGIKDVTNLGSTKAYGFGRSSCPASCFNNYTSTLRITLDEPTFVSTISFRYMELFDNWGSNGTIFIDGVSLTGGRNFQGVPSNSRRADTTFTEGVFSVNRLATVIELRVVDITNLSEIYIDDLKVFTADTEP